MHERSYPLISHGPAAPSDITWLHADHLGSTSLVTSNAGAFIEETKYLPYGAVQSTHRLDDGLPYEPYGFTGKEAEPDFGILYFGARYYNPHLARWMSPDPLYLIMTQENAEKVQNIYEYCSNDPFNNIDMDGLDENDLATLMAKFQYRNHKSYTPTEFKNKVAGYIIMINKYSSLMTQEGITDKSTQGKILTQMMLESNFTEKHDIDKPKTAKGILQWVGTANAELNRENYLFKLSKDPSNPLSKYAIKVAKYLGKTKGISFNDIIKAIKVHGSVFELNLYMVLEPRYNAYSDDKLKKNKWNMKNLPQDMKDIFFMSAYYNDGESVARNYQTKIFFNKEIQRLMGNYDLDFVKNNPVPFGPINNSNRPFLYGYTVYHGAKEFKK